MTEPLKNIMGPEIESLHKGKKLTHRTSLCAKSSLTEQLLSNNTERF